MKKTIASVIIIISCIACGNEISYDTGTYFTLERTEIDFGSAASEAVVPFVHALGETRAAIVSEDSNWCSVSVSGTELTVKASENILSRSRLAKISVKNGDREVLLLVRQAKKLFGYIAAVQNLQAIPGLGEITLKWDEPVEDNFSHVVIRFRKGHETQVVVLEEGVTEYTVKELKNADGEHTFSVQSIDVEGEAGEIVSISAVPGKLVAIRFEADLPMQWLPYYLKTSDNHELILRVGSMEFNEGEAVHIAFETAPDLLAEYNRQYGTEVQLLPQSACNLPDDFVFASETSFQDLVLTIHTSELEDRTVYGLPIRIKSASPAQINDIMPATLVLFTVDDLAGWYTVDRLPKCGEVASNYPSDIGKRRRYIKRTGETTWETGYLFRTYTRDENHSGSFGDTQFISIDPETKAIHIQQGDYEVSHQLSFFDLAANELHIEYEYKAWAGWWTHERMYNRSVAKEP